MMKRERNRGWGLWTHALTPNDLCSDRDAEISAINFTSLWCAAVIDIQLSQATRVACRHASVTAVTRLKIRHLPR